MALTVAGDLTSLMDGNVAVAVAGSVPLNNAALRDRIARLADELQHHGLEPGHSVEISIPASSAQVVALLGAWASGLRVVYASNRGGAHGALQVAAEGVSARLVASTDGYVEVLAASTAGPRTHDRNTAYVTFTSGTSGSRSAVAQEAETLTQISQWLVSRTRMSGDSRVALWAAPGYDASLVEIVAGVLAGATLVPVPDIMRAHAERFVDWLDEHGITHLQTVPTFAAEIVDAIESRRRSGSLRCIALAGEELRYALVDRIRLAFPAVHILNLYGSTETVLATFKEVTTTGEGAVPIGRAIPGRVVTVQNDEGTEVAAGVEGAIVVQTRFISPATHCDRSGPTPRYVTGDRGIRLADGDLVFCGRAGSVAKVNGVRVDLEELGQWLRDQPGVRGAQVRSVDGRRGQRLRVDLAVAAKTGRLLQKQHWRRELLRQFGTRLGSLDVHISTSVTRNQGGKLTFTSDCQPADERNVG